MLCTHCNSFSYLDASILYDIGINFPYNITYRFPVSQDAPCFNSLSGSLVWYQYNSLILNLLVGSSGKHFHFGSRRVPVRQKVMKSSQRMELIGFPPEVSGRTCRICSVFSTWVLKIFVNH